MEKSHLFSTIFLNKVAFFIELLLVCLVLLIIFCYNFELVSTYFKEKILKRFQINSSNTKNVISVIYQDKLPFLNLFLTINMYSIGALLREKE